MSNMFWTVGLHKCLKFNDQQLMTNRKQRWRGGEERGAEGGEGARGGGGGE